MITLNNEILELKVLKRGVTITSFKHLKDNINIITAYKDLSNYEDDSGAYLGALIGPLAGRTEPSSYGLELDANNGPNHLHGGSNPLSEVVFECEHTNDKAIFTANHLDVDYTITLTLSNETFELDLKAVPNENTPLNLTNHMYFNLLGENDLDKHHIQLNANFYSHVNKVLLNTNTLMSVTDSVFDLRKSTNVSDLLKENHPQFKRTRHIDHSFKTNEVTLNANNKSLNIKASMPYIHLYFANYFDESFIDEKNRKAKNHASIAIEPQYLPNDIDMPFYDKNNVYHEKISYSLTFTA